MQVYAKNHRICLFRRQHLVLGAGEAMKVQHSDEKRSMSMSARHQTTLASNSSMFLSNTA